MIAQLGAERAPQSHGTPICLPGKTTPVGTVRDHRFYQTRYASTQFLRKPPAIAFDPAVLDAAEAAGARLAVITDAETRTVYRAELETVRTRGRAFDRGFGAQIALPLPFWAIDGEPPQVQRAEEQQAAAAAQLSLFEAGV